MRQFKASMFRALGHPTRVALIESLQHGELSVGDLSDRVGIPQANASQHLAVLKQAHIVSSRKTGNTIFYRLTAPQLTSLLEQLSRFVLGEVAERLAALRDQVPDASLAAGSPRARRRAGFTPASENGTAGRPRRGTS